MEEVCIRFSCLAEEILKKVDYSTLIEFRKSSRDVFKALDNRRFFWKQIIALHVSGNINSYKLLDLEFSSKVLYLL